MTEPRWLTSHEVRVAHERQLTRFGGPPGLRDANARESALARPSTAGVTSKRGRSPISLR